MASFKHSLDLRRVRKSTTILREWLGANTFNQAMLDSEWNVASQIGQRFIVKLEG